MSDKTKDLVTGTHLSKGSLFSKLSNDTFFMFSDSNTPLVF